MILLQINMRELPTKRTRKSSAKVRDNEKRRQQTEFKCGICGMKVTHKNRKRHYQSKTHISAVDARDRKRREDALIEQTCLQQTQHEEFDDSTEIEDWELAPGISEEINQESEHLLCTEPIIRRPDENCEADHKYCEPFEVMGGNKVTHYSLQHTSRAESVELDPIVKKFAIVLLHSEVSKSNADELLHLLWFAFQKNLDVTDPDVIVPKFGFLEKKVRMDLIKERKYLVCSNICLRSLILFQTANMGIKRPQFRTQFFSLQPA